MRLNSILSGWWRPPSTIWPFFFCGPPLSITPTLKVSTIFSDFVYQSIPDITAKYFFKYFCSYLVCHMLRSRDFVCLLHGHFVVLSNGSVIFFCLSYFSHHSIIFRTQTLISSILSRGPHFENYRPMVLRGRPPFTI